MKFSAILFVLFGSVTAMASGSQVQLCEGTAAFGSEGQGVAVSAFINYTDEKNYQTNISEKKCEIGLAFSYEYGNDRGFRFGRLVPYSMYPKAAGKTNCAVIEENGEIYLTVTRVPPASAKKTDKPLKILVDRCKLTEAGS